MNKEQLAKAITKAIAYAENGGKPDLKNPKKGKTGEMKSIFQYTPGTWKSYSKQILGKDNVPLNADTESYITHQKISKWIEEDKKNGFSDAQIIKRIASRWNAGPGEPEAYTGKFSNGSPSNSINKKYNVRYDVPGYANKVDSYVSEFLGTKKGGPSVVKAPEVSQATTTQDPLKNVLSLMQKASTNTQTSTPVKVEPNKGGIMPSLTG